MMPCTSAAIPWPKPACYVCRCLGKQDLTCDGTGHSLQGVLEAMDRERSAYVDLAEAHQDWTRMHLSRVMRKK